MGYDRLMGCRYLIVLILMLAFLVGTGAVARASGEQSASLAAGTASGEQSAVQTEVLPVDQAFEVHGRVDGQTVRVQFAVVDGYYLYRDRLRLEGHRVRARSLLPGRAKDDPHFGRVQVYYDAVTLDADFTGALPLRFDVTFQGCADQGFCYPARTRTFDLVTEGAFARPVAVGDFASPRKLRFIAPPQRVP
jgi:thiol:disulfide interchange protein DsbD